MGPPLGARDRVLVRMPSWLGDSVMAEPALRSLVAATGDGERLSLALPAALAPLFADRFPRARMLRVDGGNGVDGSQAPPRAWRGHDVAVLLTGSWRSAWYALRAGIPRRVGWSRDGRSPLLSDRVRPALERGGLPVGNGLVGGGRRYLPRPFGAACAELLGLFGLAVHDPRPRLTVADEVRERVRARLLALGLAAGEPFCLVNAGSRAGSAKGYPRWGEVLDALGAWTSLPVVLVFGPGEEPAAEAVRAGSRSLPRLFGPPAADLCELVALTEASALVLTADSGPRHVAVACGKPVVCVAGPTDPRHTADGLERTTLLRFPVDCGPCHLERCPLSGEAHHRCMRAIAPEDVARAAAVALQPPSAPPVR